MSKAPYVMKRFLDLWLTVIIVGAVIACAVVVVSWVSEGAVTLAVPVRFEQAARPLAIDNEILGEGTIWSAAGMAEFPVDASALHSVAFLLAVASTLAPALVIVLLLRRIAVTVIAGEPFAPVNIERIRAVGLLVMAFEFIRGAAMLGVETAMMATSTISGFALRSLGEWNLGVFMLGVVIIALAEVFRYGMQLQSDVDLTV